MSVMSENAKETLATNPEYRPVMPPAPPKRGPGPLRTGLGGHGPGHTSRSGMGRGGQIHSRIKAPKTGPDI